MRAKRLGLRAVQPRQLGDRERGDRHRAARRGPRRGAAVELVDAASRRRARTRCRSRASPAGSRRPRRRARRARAAARRPPSPRPSSTCRPRRAPRPSARPPGLGVLLGARRRASPGAAPSRGRRAARCPRRGPRPSSTASTSRPRRRAACAESRAERAPRPTSLADAEEELGDELVEPLVAAADRGERVDVDRLLAQPLEAVLARPRAASAGSARSTFATASASWISGSSAKRSRLLLQDQVRAHAAAGELPHAVGVLGAVRVRVEVAHARPTPRPRAASRGRTRPSRPRSRSGSPGRTCPATWPLRSMWKSLSAHSTCATAWWNDSPLIVSCANSGFSPTISGNSSSSMNASAWPTVGSSRLPRGSFGFGSSAISIVVAAVGDVRAAHVDRLRRSSRARPGRPWRRRTPRPRARPTSRTPRRRARRRGRSRRASCAARGRRICGSLAVNAPSLNTGLREQVRRRHRHLHARSSSSAARNRLRIASRSAAVRPGRDQVVVVEVHAVRAEVGEPLHGLDRVERRPGLVAERVAAPVPDRPEPEREVVLGCRFVSSPAGSLPPRRCRDQPARAGVPR